MEEVKEWNLTVACLANINTIGIGARAVSVVGLPPNKTFHLKASMHHSFFVARFNLWMQPLTLGPRTQQTPTSTCRR